MVFIDVIGPDGMRTLAFGTAELTIGSSTDNDLQLDHADVAPHHASVIDRGGHAVVLDSGASSTFVNERQINEATVLSALCQVKIGPFRLRFRHVDLPPDTLQTTTERIPAPVGTTPAGEEDDAHGPLSASVDTPVVRFPLPPLSRRPPSREFSSHQGHQGHQGEEPDSIAPETTPMEAVRSLLKASNDPVEVEFLRSILEDEDPGGARIVYADWLEEQHDTIRAEYMRLLDTLRPNADPDDREPARLRMLGAKIANPWRATVAPRWTPIERCPLMSDRYRLLNCPKTWGAVGRGSVDDLRRCAGCTRYVQFVTDVDAARVVTSQNTPVAVDPSVRRSADDLEPLPSVPVYHHIVIGRCPSNLELPADHAPLTHDAAQLFASCSALEAAAVTAFERLAQELARLGAPSALVRRALIAACDETRHARTMKALGNDGPVAYALTHHNDEEEHRSEIDIARENAIEGCVRETYGALVASYQAEHATSDDVRSALATIAIEERSHAQLSWDVARWIEARLSSEERAEIDGARAKAIDDLLAEVAIDPSEEVARVAGYPSGAIATSLVREVLSFRT